LQRERAHVPPLTGDVINRKSATDQQSVKHQNNSCRQPIYYSNLLPDQYGGAKTSCQYSACWSDAKRRSEGKTLFYLFIYILHALLKSYITVVLNEILDDVQISTTI